jgi:hypothetical protein
MERAYAIPDEVSDINVDKCPHIVCFLDYKRALESKSETAKGPFMNKCKTQLFIRFLRAKFHFSSLDAKSVRPGTNFSESERLQADLNRFSREQTGISR